MTTMTIGEARAILGEKYDTLPDEDLQKLINYLIQFAVHILDLVEEAQTNPETKARLDKVLKAARERKKR